MYVVEKIKNESLIDCKLQGRFTILRKIDEGSFGQIYKVTDKEDEQKHLVVKVSRDLTMMAHEIKVSKKVDRSQVISFGLFTQNGVINSFMVMPRYGINLENYFHHVGKEFSQNTVIAIGKSLLSSLESIHNAGYIFNDLKPDNILFDYPAKIPKFFYAGNALKYSKLHIIDFGFAQKYIDGNKYHLPQTDIDKFQGNILFASRDQLNFKSTSRKDDLESLMYLLIYLISKGNLMGMGDGCEQDLDQRQWLKISQNTKNNTNIDQMCSGYAQILKPFCQEVLKIEYDQQPDYENLKSILENAS